MSSRKALIGAGAGAIALVIGATLMSTASSTTAQVTVGRHPEAVSLQKVRSAVPDPSLPAGVAKVNGQPITKIELAQVEEIIGNGHVTNPYSKTTEEAALNALIDTTVADQVAEAQGLDPRASEAQAALKDLLRSGKPLSTAIAGAGLDANTYQVTIRLYQLAAGRHALMIRVTSRVPEAQKGAAWASYVNSLVQQASVIKYGGL